MGDRRRRQEAVSEIAAAAPRRRAGGDAEVQRGAVVQPEAGGPAEVSSLPPMPVTDGSASFGLPARSTDRVGDGKACGAAAGGDFVEADGGAAGAEYGDEEFGGYQQRGCGGEPAAGDGGGYAEADVEADCGDQRR